MPPKLGSVTVTIDATPRIDTEVLSRAMHDVLRRNGIGEYATVEEALRHRAVGCDTCTKAAADEQRDSILPAADDLPRAADDSEGSDGG
jgi:hypothetical protein